MQAFLGLYERFLRLSVWMKSERPLQHTLSDRLLSRSAIASKRVTVAKKVVAECDSLVPFHHLHTSQPFLLTILCHKVHRDKSLCTAKMQWDRSKYFRKTLMVLNAMQQLSTIAIHGRFEA